MANQIALKLHSRPGDVLVADRFAHVVIYEYGGAAVHAGLMIEALDGRDGRFTVEQLEEVTVPSTKSADQRTSVLAVENTHNSSGGRCWPIDELEAMDVDPVVVDLVVDPSIAVGDVPWGLGPYLREVLPGTEVIAARDITADEVAKTAGSRTIVVVTRDAHRHTGARQLVTNLTNLGLNVVHVETGVPGPDLGSVARIDTHGGSRVSLRAAAELILKGTT